MVLTTGELRRTNTRHTHPRRSPTEQHRAMAGRQAGAGHRHPGVVEVALLEVGAEVQRQVAEERIPGASSKQKARYKLAVKR